MSKERDTSILQICSVVAISGGLLFGGGVWVAASDHCNDLSSVDINNAPKDDLVCIVQIGDSRADDLVSLRPFSSLDGLEDISGISSGRVQEIRNQGLATLEDADVSDGEDDEEANGEDEEDEGTSTEDGEDGQNGATAPSDLSAHTAPVELSEADITPSVSISAGPDRLTSTEKDLRFRAYVDDDEDLPRSTEFRWTLGDGSVSYGRNITHTYYAPGTYTVVLSVSAGDEEAISRTTVEVVEADIYIKGTTEETVVLGNAAEREINLGNWTIEVEDTDFRIPSDTLISEGGDLAFHSFVTGIAPEKEGNITLRSPEGSVVSTTSLSEAEAEESDEQRHTLETENEYLRERLAALHEERDTLARELNERERFARAEETSSDPVAPESDEDENGTETELDDEGDVSEIDDTPQNSITYELPEREEGGVWNRLFGAPGALLDMFSF